MTDLAINSRTALDPLTGEVLELATLTGQDLAAALERIGEAYGALGEFKAGIVEEVARRADARNTRKVELDGIKWEVNAPTEDHYAVEDVRRELNPLVDAGVLDRQALDDLIRYPPPTRPPPAVDRRKIATLWKSESRELLSALARARRRTHPKRTAKIIGRTVDTTATEETTP